MDTRTRKRLARCYDEIDALYEELLSINHKSFNSVENEVMRLLTDRVSDCRLLGRTLSSKRLSNKTRSYAGKVRLL